MPYNTRRKSVSLSAMGIHVPVSKDQRAAAALASRQKSPTTLSSASADGAPVAPSLAFSSTPSLSPRSPAERPDQPAQAVSARKQKRSHALVDSHAHQRQSSASKRRQTVSNTPPPSPGFDRPVFLEMDHDHFHAADHDINLASIHDDIVEKVIVRLQATNNRPHIVKELAGILFTQLKIVQQSANPSAIISSRLSAFIKRNSWNSRNPCPLGKELETIHPRRTYFYLTTSPHQPLPDPHAQAAPKALPTPSASSESDVDDDDRRRVMSPSPELELEPYRPHGDYNEEEEPMPATPLGSFPTRHSIASQSSITAEPPLEKDEKEFTQTASGLRKLSGDFMSQSSNKPKDPVAPTIGVVMDEHVKYDTFFSDAKTLDATVSAQHNLSTPTTSLLLLSSPDIRPAARPPVPIFSLDMGKLKADHEPYLGQCDTQLGWDRSPEQVDLDELDSLLTGFYR